MIEMSERHQDFELLQRFTRDGEQSAFADLVRRHLDLVYATALRKVADAGGAQEISQNVFSVLARKAWRFAPDDSLPAWLYKTALLESKAWLRGEMRRRRREAAAAELGTTMKISEDQPAFHALVPLLDDALLSLREKDRTALLLRFFESHSLRDVGAAFGVSEDTAQKRVQSALEKLAEFFKRRGFKTTTVAATAAALQHTAAPASAAVVGAVVSAALRVAPPALVGLGAWLARLVSMSRVQTAAVCVTLAALPLAWQLNERHAAAAEVRWIQTLVLAARNEGANVQAEIERLRAISGSLEQAVAQRNEAAARALEAERAFAAWKKKTRDQLIAEDYHWDEASPFVRIPKSVLPELCRRTTANSFNTFCRPGNVVPYARELLGLTSTERQAVEAMLQRHFSDIDNLLAAGMRETNIAVTDRIVAARAFVSSPQDQGDKRIVQTMAEIRSLLGEERWALLTRLADRSPGTPYSSDVRRLLGPEELNLEVSIDDSLTMGYRLAGTETWIAGGKLSMFLPEGNPNRKEFPNYFTPAMWGGLRERVVAWLQEQAIARLGSQKENP